MAVPPEFIEDLRQRVPLSDIIGRRVKLIRKGRRFSGLCPFHSEKTPSFSVVDDDGFYHCFGCGAHGDAISFLREMDGLDFMEAVERLADMAGLAMPKSTHIDPAVTRQRKAAFDILEETTKFFEARLRADEGRDAAHYIKQRGLDAATVKNFRLGYAPRSGLQAVLASKGFSDDDMILAGVLGKSDRDGRLYDYFRDRVIFPIENRQGKVIAFGARALGDAQPKYLNSGDSPTFSKKAVLYGWVQAREAVRRKLPLVVVEGYMDVIAVQRSGIAAAVAPLGTALTPEQIALLWKLHDEPILCFDGDAAGQRAQFRARWSVSCHCLNLAGRRGWRCCQLAKIQMMFLASLGQKDCAKFWAVRKPWLMLCGRQPRRSLTPNNQRQERNSGNQCAALCAVLAIIRCAGPMAMKLRTESRQCDPKRGARPTYLWRGGQSGLPPA